MSGEGQNATTGTDPLGSADSSKARILQKQYEFEQLLMNNQLWADQQAVKLEVDIKSVALYAAAEASEVCKFLPDRRNDSVVEVVKELNSRRPCIEMQKQQPLPLGFSTSKDKACEKDIRDEKEGPHCGREYHVSLHRRHGRHRSNRGGRSRSRSRDRHRSKTRHSSNSRNKRDSGHNSHRHQSRSRSTCRSPSGRS